MKISTLLAASALTFVAAQASAATHTISGTGSLLATASNTNSFVNSTYVYIGEGDLSGNAFSFTLEQQVSNLFGVNTAQIYTAGTFDITTGVGSQEIIGCTGNANVCGGIDPVVGTPSAFTPYSAVNIANGATLDWDTITMGQTVPNFGLFDSISNLSASPSAVPVPAAAWLFGSALLGLAGIGRNRK